MKPVSHQEMPNIDDPDLVRCCLAVGHVRSSLVGLTLHIIGQLGEQPVTIPTRCALAALNRVADSSLSAELLCQKNRVRDAAILILSIFELRLDLQFIALDTSRAFTWIEHAQENAKPWRVASQLNDVYSDRGELDAQFAMYRQYSMVKHCNPAGKSLAFPLAVTSDTIELDTTSSNSHWIRVHAFALSVQLQSAAKAAISIWKEESLDTGDFALAMQTHVDDIWSRNEAHITHVLRDEIKRSSNG